MTETKSRRIFLLIFLPLFAGFVALLLWPEEWQESEIIIRIEPNGVGDGLIISGINFEKLEAKVIGPKSVIDGISGLQLLYPLNLTGFTSGVHTLSVNDKLILLPVKTRIETITPVELTVHLEKEMVKEIPVVLSLSGKPAVGFVVAGAETKPALAKFRGPETFMKPLKAIKTKPLDINGLSEAVKKEIVLDLPRGVEVVPSEIFVADILITERIITRRFENIPVKGKGTSHPYTITPKSMAIEVKGPSNDLETLLTKNEMDVFVKLTGLAPGVYVRRATITLPVNTTLIGANPEVFTVKVKKP